VAIDGQLLSGRRGDLAHPRLSRRGDLAGWHECRALQLACKSWVTDDSDIVRTPGTESNVKEIYDKCNELRRDPQNVILNQFAEYGNYLVHYLCTGRAAEQAARSHPGLTVAAFVSATGSAGTTRGG
jgi:hypothetical protein